MPLFYEVNMKIKVTGTKTDFAVGDEIVCDVIPSHLVNKCVVIDDSELEVATPGGEDDNDDEEEGDEDDAPHTENQHDDIIPSHYNPVIAQVEAEQPKPKRGRPSSK